VAVLDTSVLIDLLRGPRNQHHVRAVRELASLRARGEAIATTRINVAELFVGVELSSDPARERRSVELLMQPMIVLDFDQPAAEHFGVVAAHLRRLGLPSGDLDTLIATIAIVNGQELITRNPAHFTTIPGLAVRTY
jgi:tRNA(fMet)-specific endonuclease VapC